ncbi:MAG: hypothetical protein WCT33_05980 [Patescibacteria group bacterium]
MKKVFKPIPGGKVKRIKNRFGNDQKSSPDSVLKSKDVITRILDREAQEALVEGDHPAAHVEVVSDPADLRHTVVSCGRPEDDDTDGSDQHWFIPVEVPSSSGSCSPRKVASNPPIRREFRPKLRQILPIDAMIRRSA